MNPLRGESPLVVGEQTYKLVLDVNAYCSMEAVLDRDTDRIVAEAVAQAGGGTGVNLSLWRGILWGALQEHHPCAISDAGKIIATAGVVAVKQAVMRALRASFGMKQAEDGEQSDPPNAGDAGTG